MFEAIYKIVLFLLLIGLAYLLGKKNQYDKGYDKGWFRGYDVGYNEGKTNTLKEIHEINKRKVK